MGFFSRLKKKEKEKAKLYQYHAITTISKFNFINYMFSSPTFFIGNMISNSE